jgi:hypothetical protein
VALPERVVAEEKRFFIALGGPKAHDSSVENTLHPPDFERVAQVSILRPGFLLAMSLAGRLT